MIPTMKLRLHSTSNAVTSEMVQAERRASEDSMSECKRRLEDRTEPQLQQWFAAGPGEIVEGGGRWMPVEVVHEIIPVPKKASSALARPQ